jgi:hypothetical protein
VYILLVVVAELAHLMREAIKGVIRGHDDVHQAPREIGARSHRRAHHRAQVRP